MSRVGHEIVHLQVEDMRGVAGSAGFLFAESVGDGVDGEGAGVGVCPGEGGLEDLMEVEEGDGGRDAEHAGDCWG